MARRTGHRNTEATFLPKSPKGRKPMTAGRMAISKSEIRAKTIAPAVMPSAAS